MAWAGLGEGNGATGGKTEATAKSTGSVRRLGVESTSPPRSIVRNAVSVNVTSEETPTENRKLVVGNQKEKENITPPWFHPRERKEEMLEASVTEGGWWLLKEEGGTEAGGPQTSDGKVRRRGKRGSRGGRQPPLPVAGGRRSGGRALLTTTGGDKR